MTIITILDLTIIPEKVEKAPAAIEAILTATRAFDGCLRVEIATDMDDAGHILLIEQWESLEADDAYRAWRTTPEGANDLRSYLVTPPVVTKY